MSDALRGTPGGRRLVQLRAMARVGVRMMFHDKLKLVGTMSGVIFAVLLSVQQLSILFALLNRNTQFVDNAGADIWIAPPNTVMLQRGEPLTEAVLYQARSTPNVDEAQPLLFTAGTIDKTGGGSEPVSVIGFETTSNLGAPWNVVAGDRSALEQPDTMFFEDSQREKYGAMNLGSIREINGHRVRAGGFTWGLIPFGPAYSFADIDLARDITNTPIDRLHFVLIRVREGVDVVTVQQALARRLPETLVLTRDEFHTGIIRQLLRDQLGMSFGITTAVGLLIGLVIVALSMFSSVLDNLREFGTLKAIGCKNSDLTALLLVQSVLYALLGSVIGLGLVVRVVEKIRQPLLVPMIPKEVFAILPVVMVTLCLFASTLALLRIRRLEPGMVFR